MEIDKLYKKLYLLKAQKRLIVNAPQEFTTLLGDVEFETQVLEKEKAAYDYVHLFAATQEELEALVQKVAPNAQYDGYFWISYPKGTGSIKSDIKRGTVWTAMDLVRLRPVTQVAIDDTWSALRGRPHDKVGKK